MTATQRTGARLSKHQRREQLLDVAAEFVLANGLAPLTMERLAESAGVSKALPYAHFHNIEHALVVLYRRESVALGSYIWDALEGASPGRDLFRVHIAAYFEGLERSNDVIGVLTTPGSTIPVKGDPRQDGPRFSARVLRRFHGVDPESASILGATVNAAVLAAGNTWRSGVAERAACEDMAVHILRSAVAWEGSAPA